MANTLKIDEESYSFWRTTAIISGILSLVFFGIFWIYSDPFWTSILRLVAFVFFAGAIMAYLKVMDGPLQIVLETTDELLLVNYVKDGEIIQEEQFELDTITQISSTKRPKNTFNNFLQPQSVAFQISFTDTDNDIYLFEFSGRQLLFGRNARDDIANFLSDAGINS